jgi:lysophospholipase L1-like esterase
MNPSLRIARIFSTPARFGIAIILFVFIAATRGLAAEPQTPAHDSQAIWENDIQAFEQWDRKNSFPANAVLFVGSSTIRLWMTSECFSDLPVINRGFGGSQIAQITPYVHRIVLPYRPRAIVFYAGDNDIAAGKSPQVVADDFREFVRRVREKLTDTPIYFLSIKPSPSRWSMWKDASQANTLIRDFCQTHAELHFVDMSGCLLQENGSPNPAYFQPDKLHLNEQGYKLWTQKLAPLLRPSLRDH